MKLNNTDLPGREQDQDGRASPSPGQVGELRRHPLLAQLAAMPAGALIPAEWVRAQLEHEGAAHGGDTSALDDLDVDGVAAIVGRAPSTVRGWLGRGLIEGAYRLQQRDWRIPRAALRRFLDQQASERQEPTARRARPAELGEWRKHLREVG
jgi:hypothetical protein